MSRRVAKAVNGQATAFAYQGWAMFKETTSSSTISYVYGLDLSGTSQGAGTIGGILCASLNGSTAFYAYDANGNVTDLVGTNGSFVAKYQYDPYGNTIAKSGDLADANPFRFSTKYTDSESGLVYYGYRYYVPELSKWLSRDPIKEVGWRKLVSNPVVFRRSMGKNLFNYCRNSPINFYDPVGLEERCNRQESCSEGATRDLLSNCDVAGGYYTGEMFIFGKGNPEKELPSACCYCDRNDYDIICDVTRQKCTKATIFCFDDKCKNITRTYDSTAWFDQSFTPKVPIRTVDAGRILQWCHQASMGDLLPPHDYYGWMIKQGFECKETCRGLAGSSGPDGE